MADMNTIGAIKDREFQSYDGVSYDFVWKVVQDLHQFKTVQLQQFQAQGINVDNLGILTNNRGVFLVTNNGNLLYRS
jgi:hypothetical protein